MRFLPFGQAVRAIVLLAFAILCGLSVQAHAFTHPSIPNSLEDLDTIKANLNREPWKSGYAKLAADGHSSLTYTMQGPFASVTRNPDSNLGAWNNDMTAVYNLAHMWYFTGNSAYAKKARDILIAWANTQTNFGGNQAGLALGDYAYRFGGGASILRGTWPGWTADDTAKVKNLFLNVYWPATANPWNVPGTFNKGLLNMSAGIAIAVFCDDTAKFNHVVDLYRTNPAAGLFNLLPIGETGETGRDAGHTYGGLVNAAFIAECIWKQGIDVYSDLDNRLLAAGEYYCRNTFSLDNPYVDFGTVDALYFTNAAGPYGANRAAFHLIQNAYKNRKNIPTPWIDRKLGEQWLDVDNWLYAKPADFSTATPPAAVVRPAVSPASSGLTLTTLGSNSAGRSSAYANGVWTVTGLGTGVSSDTTDDCQFAYVQMTGDCAIVAQVTSAPATTTSTKAGVMIRDNLSSTVSQRGWMAITSGTNQVQSRMNGATEVWAGRVERTTDFPAGSGLPYWVKVERRGNLVTTYSSKDGTSWCPHISDYYGNLGSTAYIGLFVMSGSATATTTATFANVAFTGGTGGLVTTPAAPAAVFTAGSSKAITVRWLPSFGATGYDLLRSTTSGSGYAAIASDLGTDKTSYVDTTAVAGTTYYYVVQAKNAVGTSGNSPEFSAALLSAPMVNLAFGGTPSASANSGSGYEKSDQAFNLDPGTKWIVPATTGWLQYDFGSGNAQVIKRYTVSSADVAGRDPKDWQFQGSQDGSTWTTLDSQSGQVFANRVQQNVYNIGNTTAYRYYRINVTANNGDAFSLAIAELGLWSDTGRTLPDGRYRLANRKSNKVAAVTGGATTDGTPLAQAGWNGADSQQWDIAWQGNGRYRATGVASAKVIDNGGTANAGTNLVIQPSSGTTSQLWTIVPDSDGFYRIASANSGLVADVSGGSTANGANIVQSTYTGGDSQLWMPSIGVAPQPIPPTPTGLAATAASTSQIDLSWTASPGAISYRIKRATVSGGPYTPLPTEVNKTTYSDSDLSPSTTYYYVVSALNGSGESADSAQAQATTLTGPPAAPTGLGVILGTNRAILSWTPTGGATSYTVLRATTSGGPYTTVATGLTSTTYTDTGLTSGGAYYYSIVAVNADGSSLGSAEVAAGPGTLVVHLKFDETGGATAADSGGGAHDATLFQGPTFGPGFLNNALNLPATGNNGQYAKLPSGIASGLTNFTIATWVKVSGTSNNTRIFDFGTGTSNYMELCPKTSANGFMRYEIVSGGTVRQINTTYTFPTDVWTHVALTQSGSTGTLYINGTSVGTNTSLTLNPAQLGFTTQNYLGKSQWGADPYLNGAIDDFRIYSQAMSAAEITALAHPPVGTPRQLAAIPDDTKAILTWAPNATITYTVKRSTTSGGPYATVATGVTSTTYTDTGLTNGVTYYYVVSGANGADISPDSAEVSVTPSTLRLHLKFDESEGDTAADSSGRAQDASLSNGPTFGAGKIGNALGFAPASLQYATLPDGIVNGLADFTAATWIKVNAFATWQRIFDFGTGTSNYMNVTTQYTGTAPNAAKLRFAIRTSSVAEQTVVGTGIALTAGTWTHVAVTRSGTTVSIYVNGSLAGSGTITLSPSDLGVTTQNYLGKSQYNDPYLNAALDDFRIYSRAMDAAELTTLITGQVTVPQNLTATGADTQIALAWQAVTNATGYNVKRSDVSGGPYTTVAVASSTGYTDTGLSSGATYYYVVSANTAVGEGTNSDEVSAITIPAEPTGLTSTNNNGQVELAWNASSGAASYTIRRATSPGGPFTTLATGVTGTSYTDTTTQHGTTYTYTVAAGNGSGESQSSTSSSTTAIFVPVVWLKLDETGGATAADAVGTNSSTLVNSPVWTGGRIGNALSLNGTNHYLTLPGSIVSSRQTLTIMAWVYWNGGGNWQRIFDFGTGTNNYMFLTPKNSANSKIRFAIRTASVSEQIIDGAATLPTAGWHHVAVTLSGTTGTLYVDGQQVGQNTAMTLRPSDLGATTQNRIGRSQFNDPYLSGRVDDFRIYSGALSASVIASLAAPIQTTGLAATGETGRISLAWSATAGATSYTVRRATTSGGAYATVASGLTGTSYADTGVVNSTPYFYVVTPTNAADDGANSAEVSATTLSVAPGNLAATVAAGRVDLTWTASTVATGYLVKRSLVSGGPYTIIATLGATTSYSDTGLVDGNPYRYIVTAVQGAVEVGDSAEVSAIPGVVATDHFTELFGSGDANDTANTSYTFTPAANANGYIVVRAAATAFSTDPAGGANLNLGDDANSAVTLSGGQQVSLFGTAYSTFYVGSNGYLTFGSGDSRFEETLANHFDRPRVSALFDDLDRTSGGTISWKQLADRVAVTWQAVPEYSAGNSNNFQVELFFDGRIRITLLSIAATDGLIGLSRGTGTPAGFAESDFSAYAGLPAIPAALSAAGGPGQVALSWSSVAGATGYRIKRATGSGGPYTPFAVSGGTGYTDGSLPNGTTYYYTVSAVNAVGESADAAPVSGTTYTVQENWRCTYFGTAANSGNAADNADPDADGMTNLQEFTAGTDPGDAASVFRVSGMIVKGDEVQLTFPTVAGKTYRLESSDTLLNGSWVPVLESILGTGDVIQITDPVDSPQPKRFYRIVVVP